MRRLLQFTLAATPFAAAARLSDDELDREHGDVRRRLRVVDQLDERSRRSNAERLLVLADRRQRGADELCKLDVVEADDGDVLGAAQAGVLDRPDRTDGHHVRRREDGGRRLREREQRPHRGLAALHVEVARRLVPGLGGQPEVLQLGSVAEQAVGGGLRVRETDDRRDPPVAEVVQVPDREPRAAEVVGGDVARPLAGEGEVDRDHGRARGDQLLQLRLLRVVDCEHDDSVDAVMARASGVCVRAAPGSRLLVREEEDVVAVRPERVLQADEHLEEERMLEIGMRLAREEDHADQLRAALDQRSRRRVRGVVELPRPREHPQACLGAHVRVAVEHARHRRHRHSTPCRDFPNRRNLRLPKFRKRFRNSTHVCSRKSMLKATFLRNRFGYRSGVGTFCGFHRACEHDALARPFKGSGSN